MNDLLRVACDTHLGIAAADVENDGIYGAGDQTTHFNVADAMVHTDDRLVPQLRQRARNHGTHLQRRTHARSLGVADHVDFFGRILKRHYVDELLFSAATNLDSSQTERFTDQLDNVLPMVVGRFRRSESLAGRSVECSPRIGQNNAVANDPHADFVGAAFDSECAHHCHQRRRFSSRRRSPFCNSEQSATEKESIRVPSHPSYPDFRLDHLR